MEENIEYYPKISIITPSFNQGQFIEETIQSVLNQDYPNLEYIVIDGGSTDETLSILYKYSDKLKWISEPDNGQTDAINKGLRMSTGDIIAYLNSDDMYEPNILREIAGLFSKHADIAMIYGDVIHINERSEFIEYLQTGEVDLERYLMGIFYIPQPSVFFRRYVIEKIGVFDEKLQLGLDYDYWLKILLNFKAMYVNQTFSRARIYSKAKSSALNHKYLDERLYILNSIFASYDLEKYREMVYGYVYFIGALIYLKKHMFLDAIKYFMRSFRKDFHYLINPHLFWGIFEVVVGAENAKKINPTVKKMFAIRSSGKMGLYYFE